MKVFVSQPMRGFADEQILEARERGLAFLAGQFPNESIELIDTFFLGADSAPLENLGESISEGLAKCDLALFIGEYEKYRGCAVEHEAAVRYEIPRVYFDPSRQKDPTFRNMLDHLKENYTERFLEKVKEVEGRVSKRKSCGCVSSDMERRGKACRHYKKFILRRAVSELWASIYGEGVEGAGEAEVEGVLDQAGQEVEGMSEGVPTEVS